MKFIMLGVSYEETSMNELNQIFLSDTNMMEIYLKLQDININQAVILSTCNRKEIYYMDEDNYIEEVKDILNKYMSHISFNIREDNEAITCAKEIKRDIHISEHPLSLSYIAIKELRQHISLKGKNALIIGSGKMATLSLTYLIDENMSSITICNRSEAHAQKLKIQYPSIMIKDYHQRYDVLRDCDILISATSSPHLVIEKDKVHFNHDIYMVDLALPRDIDVELKNNEYVF
ncbi:MAG: hypothetical protein LUF02_05780 [Erysipelotrichaceae bacterium]|nr:hypothetical protein [Erysipelotrichaceae bacterium]